MDGDEGRAAVAVARAVAEAETRGMSADPLLPGSFSRPSGVFVTVSEYPSGDLRGCIGYPEPVLPLGEALILAAKAACHDPRFEDLDYGEAINCTFEVTVLTAPEVLEHSGPEDLIGRIAVGRDGLILETGAGRGLLLPQVPREHGWDAREFLEHLSAKAGLDRDAWRRPDARISVFRGDVFSELSPGGDVIRR